jgi:dihydroorotate dehydrogenase
LGIEKLGPYADYLVINISSPNTPGLRNLQNSGPLRRLLCAAVKKRNEISKTYNGKEGKDIPLFVKIAPDLTDDDLQDIASAVKEIGVNGILVTNTSNQRPSTLISRNSDETGGLSGGPIREMSTECIRKMYSLTGGNIFIVGIGGVGSGHDAYKKLKAGASVVQLYSQMVYEGPGLISRIRSELADLMLQNGQKSLDDVIGLDHEEIFWNKRIARLKENREQGEIIID